MQTIHQIADEILDLCEIEPGEKRDCLRCEIVKAIADERGRLNAQIQSQLGVFRRQIEDTLLPRGVPDDCTAICGGTDGRLAGSTRSPDRAGE